MQIEIFSSHVGWGTKASKLTISRCRDGFMREVALEGAAHPIDRALVQNCIDALARPLVPELRPEMFDLPADVLPHYSQSFSDDDCPSILVRATDAAGRRWLVRTSQPQAFMLPLQVIGVGATFDPRLSVAIAALMPDGFLNLARLEGRRPWLEADSHQALSRGSIKAGASAPSAAARRRGRSSSLEATRRASRASRLSTPRRVA